MIAARDRPGDWVVALVEAVAWSESNLTPLGYPIRYEATIARVVNADGVRMYCSVEGPSPEEAIERAYRAVAELAGAAGDGS